MKKDKETFNELRDFLDSELLNSVSNSYPTPDPEDAEWPSVTNCPSCGCRELLCGYGGPGCCVERSLSAEI